MEVLLPEDGSMYQVFYSRGKRFNKQDSLVTRVKSNPSAMQIHWYEFPGQSINTFRIDPGTQPGQITIKSIMVQHEFHRLKFRIPLYRWQGNQLLSEFQPIHDISDFILTEQGLTVTSTGKDPYFRYTGDWQAILSNVSVRAAGYKIGGYIASCLFAIFAGWAIPSVFPSKRFSRQFLTSTQPVSRLMAFFEKLANISLIAKNVFFSIFIVALAVNALGANPFKGETVAPTDLLIFYRDNVGFESIRHSIPVEERTYLHPSRSDIIDWLIPSWKAMKDTIRKGGDPWWGTTRNGGSIGIQNFTRGYFTPAFWLFCAFNDDALGFYLGMLINVIIAGLGTFFLLRMFISPLPACFGAVVFMFSGQMIGWFFTIYVQTAIWFPWLLWATAGFLKNNNPKWLPGITVTTVLLILGGYPFVAACGLYAVALFVLLWNIFSFQTLFSFFKRTILPFVAISIAFIMLSVFLWSFIEYSDALDIMGPRRGFTNFKGITDLKHLINYSAGERNIYPEPHKNIHPSPLCYVGLLPVILAMVGILTLIIPKTEAHVKKFTLYALILAILAVTIAFGLVEHEFIRKLPIFNKNGWHRANFLTDIALAILASIGLNFIFKGIQMFVADRNAPRVHLIWGICIGMLLLFQYHDQKTLHQKLNAVTPAEWFYPETPSIKFVTNHLFLLQYVLADSSYFISGMLGAYGISEWFSHDFHSQTAKNILSQLVQKPFVSRTAALFSHHRIQFDRLDFEQLIDVFGIRFILLDARSNALARLQERANNWILHQFEDSVIILERKNPIQGAYHVNELENLPSQEEALNMGVGLKVEMKTNTRIVITNTRYKAGWVVLPMRAYPGWHAYVDNKKVPVDTYLGLFPAINVNKPCEILYIYESSSLKYGMLLSFMGIICFVGFIIVTYHPVTSFRQRKLSAKLRY